MAPDRTIIQRAIERACWASLSKIDSEHRGLENNDLIYVVKVLAIKNWKWAGHNMGRPYMGYKRALIEIIRRVHR